LDKCPASLLRQWKKFSLYAILGNGEIEHIRLVLKMQNSLKIQNTWGYSVFSVFFHFKFRTPNYFCAFNAGGLP
jgi:hypothetical protein